MQSSGISEPRREANSLLSFALKKDRTFLIAHTEYELTKEEENHFYEFIKRRAEREPFQHISGIQEFYGLEFFVSQDVLIPRPETELLVEAGIEILQNHENSTFCEVGIGSGCISVSILSELKNTQAIGLDISEKALRVAENNAERHDVLDRLNILESDIFEVLDCAEKFDLIVSNPPYIPSKDIKTLQIEVRDFDPHIALTDGKDGLSIIKRIIDESPKHLKAKGFLLVEIGFDQSEKVKEMFSREIWKKVEFLRDLQGIQRVVRAQIVVT